MSKKAKAVDKYMFHLYVHMNEVDHFVVFNGVSIKQLLESTELQPYLLLLKHIYEDGEFNSHTHFEYIASSDLPALIKSYDGKRKDLCLVDFLEEHALNELSPQEQAQLLYFAHKREPLNNPFSSKMQNRFLYYHSADQNETKMYFRFLADCEIIVANIFNRLIEAKEGIGSFWRKRAKRNFPKLDPVTLRAYRNYAKEGVLVSLYKLEKPNSTYGVEIRTASEINYSDDIWSELEEILTKGYDEHILIS